MVTTYVLHEQELQGYHNIRFSKCMGTARNHKLATVVIPYIKYISDVIGRIDFYRTCFRLYLTLMQAVLVHPKDLYTQLLTYVTQDRSIIVYIKSSVVHVEVFT